MIQLKYNDEFNDTIKDISYWKDEQDIPKHIIDYIVDNSNKRVFYDINADSYYCAKCLSKLDENNNCLTCHTEHKMYTRDNVLLGHRDIIEVVNPTKVPTYMLSNSCEYLVFDIKDQDIYLYCLVEDISYDNPFYQRPYKSSKISIDASRSYYIEKDGLTILESNEYIPFEKMINIITLFNSDDEDDMKYVDEHFDEMNDFYTTYSMDNSVYIYTDNLIDLKDTIYKYSYLWKAKDALDKSDSISLNALTLFPLCYPQFEYLIKYGLFNIAFEGCERLDKGSNFKEIFGVDKQYLSFMVENDITYNELSILRIYPTYDIEILKYFGRLVLPYRQFVNEIVLEYKVDLKKLMDYLGKAHYFSEYYDYIRMAKELRLDLYNKNVLFPKDLLEAHDELYNQIELVRDPLIDEKINSIANILKINNYEDDKYIIFPASSMEELVEESRQQKNCVRTYCKRIANYECQVYFMRKKDDKDKSFVTIEVRDNEIVQAKLKYNNYPSDDIMAILKIWEKKLIPIETEEV